MREFSGRGRRYRLRAFAQPKLDPAKGRFARGVLLAELRERTRHGRLSLRKMLPLMRTHDLELVAAAIRTRREGVLWVLGRPPPRN
jgi:hypothetical protein